MTLTELRYIVALAREQHFGRAAERCHVAQPTLSIAVKKFEEELGVALFERSRQSVKATPLGEKIVEIAGQVLEHAARIKDAAAADRDQLAGPVSIGTLPTIGPYVLPQLIPLLQQLAPGLSLYFEEASQIELVDRLRTSDIDIALLCMPVSEADIVAQAVLDEPLVLLLPASHRLAAKLEVSAGDLLVEEVLLLRDGHPLREQILEAFPHLRGPHLRGPHLRGEHAAAGKLAAIQASSLETLQHLVASGLGLTILPRAAAEVAVQAHSGMGATGALTVRKFAAPAPVRVLALAWRASFPRYKAVDVLRRALQASSAAYWDYNTERVDARPVISLKNSDW